MAETIEQAWAQRIQQTAQRQLAARLGTEEGKRAAQSVVMAYLAAMTSARDPSAYLACSDASVAACVATSIDTGLHPGGPNPTVYLVPQASRRGEQPQLQWRITHRGLAILAARAGYAISAPAVGISDRVKVSLGEVIEHEADPAAWPESMGDLLGCALVVRRLDDGIVLCRAWLPRAAILQRRAKARDKGIWDEWPLEQAWKTTIKWGAARGLIPMDSPEMRAALAADARGDIEQSEPAPVVRPRGMAALGLSGPEPVPESRRIEAPQDMPDELLDAQEQPEPELAQEPKTTPRSRQAPL